MVRTGLEVVGDLSRTYPEAMTDHVPHLIHLLIDWINNPDFNMSLRANILTCLGDFGISCPRLVRIELDRILNLYRLAFDAVTEILSRKNSTKEEKQFAESMKGCVIDSVSCICHGVLYGEDVKDRESAAKVLDFVPRLNVFIDGTVREDMNPSSV